MNQVIPNAEKRFIFVENRAGCYRTQYESESAEGYDDLMHESAVAVLCFDFADLVVQGNNLYESINSLDNDWRKLVYANEIDYSVHFENRIKRLYTGWLDVSRKVIALYGRIESDFNSRGFDTDPIHQLRRSICEVEVMECDDSRFFVDANLMALRDAAIEDYRSNRDVEFMS